MLDDFEQLADYVILSGNRAPPLEWLEKEAVGKWVYSTAGVDASSGILPVILTVTIFFFESKVDSVLFRVKFK